MKYWKIHFVLKKGSSNKYKPQLRYIQKTYKPHYLSISQQKYFDLWKAKPMPIIEFIVMAFDAIHFMNDFIVRFPKLLTTGSAEPFRWTRIPKKVRSTKIEKMMKDKHKKEKLIAEQLRKRFKDRKKRN